MSRRHGPIPPLSPADYAAGVRMEGDRLIFPPVPPPTALDRNVKSNFCPRCKKRFSQGCECAINPTLLDDKPHVSRPWGYKGPMLLDPLHPDHPSHKNSA